MKIGTCNCILQHLLASCLGSSPFQPLDSTFWHLAWVLPIFNLWTLACFMNILLLLLHPKAHLDVVFSFFHLAVFAKSIRDRRIAWQHMLHSVLAAFRHCSWIKTTVEQDRAMILTGLAGFQSHSHLQAGLASLAVTPDAAVSFLNQAHVASRDRVHMLLSIASYCFPCS